MRKTARSSNYRATLWPLSLLALVVSVDGLRRVPARPSAEGQACDLVLINGKILTVDAKDSIAEAVAINTGKIVAVGSNAQIQRHISAGTRVLDLHGRTATPGLIDR
jgi:adenine deaminase